MDTLCINNITVYPGIKPPKGIVLRETKIDKMTIWITKCKNIYYTSSSEHPISQYNIQTATYLLSHLYFIFQNIICPTLDSEIEKNIVANFLQGIVEYLKKYSCNSYDESAHDPVIGFFHYQNLISIGVNPFALSYFKFNIKTIKYQHHTLKNNTKKLIDNFNTEFENMSKEILKTIKVEKVVEKIVEVEKVVEKIVEVEKVVEKIVEKPVPNAWKVKSIMKKDISTQCELKNTQTIETQTEYVEEVVKVDKKKKSKEPYMVFTEIEYMKFMKEQNDLIAKANEEGYQRYRSNFTSFVTKERLPACHLFNILNASDMNQVIAAITLYHISFTIGSFRMSFIDSGDGRVKVKIPLFVEFWRDIILPNISKMKGEIFQSLLVEWEEFSKKISMSKVKIKDTHLNILFGHYGTVILTNCWDLQSFVPTFYLMLLRGCKNICALMGMINFYEEKERNPKLNELFHLSKDFEKLYVDLGDGKDDVEINNDVIRKLFKLDSKELI